jgi:hypothetical protein
MTAKLAAAGVRSGRRTTRRRHGDLDRATRALIVARVGKHLPTVHEAADGSAHTR